MYGNNATRSLPSIHNFAQASAHFNTTPKPPRSKKWDEHQRPLKDTSAYHYRIEREATDDYVIHYDLVLYQTVMARYYAPDANGYERRLYRSHGTKTSRDFMWNVLGIGEANTVETTTGEKVIAPVYRHAALVRQGGNDFSADFWFKDGKLDVSRSKHARHYRRVSTNQDKENRKQIKEGLQNYIMLAVMRMPEYAADVIINDNMGRPFGGHDSWRFSHRSAIEHLLTGDVTQDDIAVFFDDIGQGVFNMLASKRAYNQPSFNLPSYWQRQQGVQPSAYSDLEKPITQSDFEKALLARCYQLAGANRQSGDEELPQFMKQEDYPRTNIHV